MRRLGAVLALLVALPVSAQGWGKVATGWTKISNSGYASMPAPAGCAAASVPIFTGTPAALGCDTALTFNGTTDTLATGTVTANNVTATALATPGAITVTNVLTQTGTVNVVAGASLADGDYFTVDYGTGTIPIEFDATPGNGTTGGRIPYVFAPGDSAGTIRDGLIALINAAAPTQVTASIGGAAAVTIARIPAGTAGGTITENVANAGFTVAGFADPTHATTVTYKLVALLADGTTTEAGAASTTATATATLSASNFNRLAWSAVTGATSYRVYRTVAPTSPNTTGIVYSGTALTVDDTGLAGGGETAPTVNATGVTRANRVLAGDGTAAAPSVAFASQPGLGWYAGASNYIYMANGLGSGAAFRVSNGGHFETVGSYGLTSAVGGASDVVYGRVTGSFASIVGGSTATLQLGAANAASPVGQRLRSQGAATSADIAPADLTIGPGNMTGTGATTAAGRYGALRLSTYIPGTTGTTASSTSSDRLVIQSTPVTLTESSATPVMDFAVPSNTVAGGTVWYTIRSNDATDYQSLRGQAQWSAVNKGGTLTASIGLVGSEVAAVSSGTLTNTATISTGTNSVTINLNAVSSLTQTTLYAWVTSQNDGPGAVTTK